VQFGLFLKKKRGEKMAGGFARSIRDLEFEIDQFTNRIELVRNHFASFCQFVVVDLEKVVVFVCRVVDLFRLFVNPGGARDGERGQRQSCGL
jgi:hypothetical protein